MASQSGNNAQCIIMHEISDQLEHPGENTSMERLEISAPPLPPADHGKSAYLVLGGCVLVQAPVWGMLTVRDMSTYASLLT